MNVLRRPAEAEFLHLAFWLLLGIAAGFFYLLIKMPPGTADPLTFIAADAAVVGLGGWAAFGLYETGTDMTEFEPEPPPDEPRGESDGWLTIDEARLRLRAAQDHMDEVFKDERQPERPNPTEPQG